LPGDASHVNDQTLSIISKLTALKILQLTGCASQDHMDNPRPIAITAAGISKLAGLRQMEMLLIDGLPFHVDDLKPLYGLSRLQRLSVDNWQGMTRRRMSEIASHFPHLDSARCTLVVKAPLGLAQELFLWFPKDSRYVLDPVYLKDIKFRPLLIPDDSEIEYSPPQPGASMTVIG
jgi:hypothetical protein